MLSEWPGLSHLIKSLLILLQSMLEALSMVIESRWDGISEV